MMLSREMDPGLGRSGRVKPQLESLEDRCCPSSVAFHAHLLTLTGDSSNSTMIVRDDGHGDVRVTLNGRTTSYAGVQQILVNSKTGDDTIDYALTGKLTTSEQLSLHLGAGNDLVNLDYTKGVAAPRLKINIDGGGGDQNVTAAFGPITNTDLRLSARLGDGMEHFTALFKGNLEGRANVDVNVRGGPSTDGVYVQADGAVGASARLSVETDSEGRMDTVHVGYAGKLSGALSIHETAGRGWDWMDSTVRLTPGSTGSLVDHVSGGPGVGLLDLTVKDHGSRLKTLDAAVNAGAGLHTVVTTPNVKVTR